MTEARVSSIEAKGFDWQKPTVQMMSLIHI